MIRKIELLGSSILREKADPVEEISDDLKSLIRDMFETMYHAEGVGLAAPQVGIPLRITVLDVPDEDDETRHVLALVNPEIVDASTDTEKGMEGCLSIPGIEEAVVRPARVIVEATTPDGEAVRVEAEGLLARAIQHEIDHLDGVLFLDRLSTLKRDLALRRWRKSQAASRV